MSIRIYYDGDCPFCSNYAKYLRLQRALGMPRLIDVRKDRASLESLERAGYNLDEGMVAEIDGHRYSGADAMHALALLSSPNGMFNALNRRLFSNRILSLILYPILRLCRNLVLLLIGRQSLSAGRSQEDESLLNLLFACLGMFGFFHFLVYQFDFLAQPYPTTYLIPVLGVWLLFHPASRLTLLLLLVVFSIDAWLHMPSFSNHTILKNFLFLAVVVGGIYAAIRGQSWAAALNAIAPIGRALLLTMYIFGVFHKINSGFLNPEVSCAATLWREMPQPLSALDAPWFIYLAIYGTLVIESMIFICLLVPAFRHIGIAIGIGFHMLLALSNYALYTAFSVLSMLLHLLFLTPAAAKRITQSGLWLRAMALPRTIGGKVVVVMYGAILVLAASTGFFPLVSLVWFGVGIPLLWLIVRYGKEVTDHRVREIFVSPRWWLNVISVAFFFNCITPYLGLKTAQSMNMFANLRVEGGISNHLLLRQAPGPFGYLEDLVEIEDPGTARYFTYVKENDLRLTWYDFLNQVDRNPGVTVSYKRGGELYPEQTIETLRTDLEQTLHPQWFRKWFHFVPVDLTEPKPCARDR